jgi:methionyl-tRNA synthetase
MLMAFEMPLPGCVYAHSFWIREGRKMSKTLGNFIDLPTIEQYLDRYGLDAWRYYLSTQGPLGSTDADFADAHFSEIYHTDLVNTFGNCASRVTAMIGKYFGGQVPGEAPAGSRLTVADHDWPALCAEAVSAAAAAMERLDLPGAAAAALGLIRKVDSFINRTEPYQMAKDDSRRDELSAILYQCLEAVRIASLLLWALIPGKVEQLWGALGLSIAPREGRLHELAAWGGLAPGSTVQKVALFPRVQAAPPVKSGV